MGRYSSVQAYSDNNPNMRAVAHDATKSSSSSTNNTLQTEKVYNPYGSTAGAGSGEFHIYRHARAREKERFKVLDDIEMEQKEQLEYETKLNNWEKEAQDKLLKKRKKRMRNHASKLRKKNMNLSGVIQEQEGGDVVDEEEFEYTPLHELKKGEEQDQEQEHDQKKKKKLPVDNTEESNDHVDVNKEDDSDVASN
eukprot:345395_1